MRQFNGFFEYRRTRLYSVNSGTPRSSGTVGVGALINMIFIWLFDLRLRVHLLLGGMIALFLATMISLIAWITRFGVKWAFHPALSNSSTIN